MELSLIFGPINPRDRSSLRYVAAGVDNASEGRASEAMKLPGLFLHRISMRMLLITGALRAAGSLLLIRANLT